MAPQMSALDGEFFNEISPVVERLLSESERQINILRHHNKDTTPFWNTPAQRNRVYFDCAQALRHQAAILLDAIQRSKQQSSLIIHKLPLQGISEGQTPMYRVLHRNSAEFLILSDEMISKSVSFLQSNGAMGSLAELEQLYRQGMRHLSILQMVCSSLHAELTNQGISLRAQAPIYRQSMATLSEESWQQAPPTDTSPSVDAFSEFDQAVQSLSSELGTNTHVTSTAYEPEVNYTPSPASKASAPPARSPVDIDAVAAEFEMAASLGGSETSSSFQAPARGTASNRRARGMQRGGARGGRGSPRGAPRGRGDRGRGRGGPIPSGSNPRVRGATMLGTMTEEDKQWLKHKEQQAHTMAKDLYDILLATDIDDLEGCQVATKFVPTAKSLVTELVKVEERLTDMGAPRAGAALRGAGLHFVHLCKDSFLQDITDEQREQIQQSQEQLFSQMNAITRGTLMEITPEVEKKMKPIPSSTSTPPAMVAPPSLTEDSPPTAPPSTLQSPQRALDRPKMRCATMIEPSMLPGTQGNALDKLRSPSTMVPKSPASQSSAAHSGRITSTPKMDSSPGSPAPLPRQAQRERAVEEIFQSEKVYLKTLQRMIWMYKKPLQEASERIVSEREINDIFSNVEEMFQLNKKLMRDLERTKNKANASVADVFLDAAPSMLLYSDYINNFDISAFTYNACMNRSAFRTMMEQFNLVANEGVTDLTSYLIQPIQRLPRYEMLIGVSCFFGSVRGWNGSLTIRDGKAVAKLTDDDHPEKEKLVLAQKKIKEVNDQINNNKRAAERKDAVFFIDKRLQEKPGSLIILKDGRELIHTGIVQRVENMKTGKTEQREVHLFSDSFLISKNRGDGPEGPYKYKAFIVPVFTAKAEVASGYPSALRFTQTTSGEVIEEIWLCPSDNDRDRWVELLNEMRDSSTFHKM